MHRILHPQRVRNGDLSRWANVVVRGKECLMQKMSWVWFLILLTGGCSFNVKTPVVADYQKLNTVQLTSTRNDIELMLGTPQGSGLHIAYDNSYPLSFYYGFAGVFTLSTAKYDSGTAFVGTCQWK